ncbi:DUF6461 domain-containing protein [Streptomyces anulatus]
MNAESADRSWLRDFHCGFLLEGYTLTLVRGLTPREYLDRIGAQPQKDCDGFDDFMVVTPRADGGEQLVHRAPPATVAPRRTMRTASACLQGPRRPR